MSFIRDAALESIDYYGNRVKSDIERNRKGSFGITVLRNGNVVPNAEISYKLKRHDFDFGSNIFMLGQYDSEEQQDTYLTQ